jgi:hypothetical protein
MSPSIRPAKNARCTRATPSASAGCASRRIVPHSGSQDSAPAPARNPRARSATEPSNRSPPSASRSSPATSAKQFSGGLTIVYAPGASPLGGAGLFSSRFVVLGAGGRESSRVDLAFRHGCDGRGGDAIGVEMVPCVREVSALASVADRISRPSQEYRGLGHVEWPGTVLEHLWNKTAVDRLGPLVRRGPGWC